jgi:hypothetical protein
VRGQPARRHVIARGGTTDANRILARHTFANQAALANQTLARRTASQVVPGQVAGAGG